MDNNNDNTNQPKYSAFTGLLYVFNVIVGTGAIALPLAFANTGYILSSLVLVLLAFVSYVTVTFMIEAMAISNAILLLRPQTTHTTTNHETDTSADSEDSSDSSPLLLPHPPDPPLTTTTSNNPFEIKKRIEMGQMAELYLNKTTSLAFYTCLITYLYGDLAIYISVVSNSLKDITCPSSSVGGNYSNTTCPYELTPPATYHFYNLLFLILIGPLCLFKITKTKYLQLTTTILRWSAFITMITLAIIQINTHTPVIPSYTTSPTAPPLATPTSLPTLFGVAIYSYMCHHSLPSLVTPISSHTHQIKFLFLLDYTLITIFYLLLSLTATFAFYPQINPIYTLNFTPYTSPILSIPLALFPVFTLTTNFPIISITLKNNLLHLLAPQSATPTGTTTNLAFTALTILPPFLLSVFVTDVQILVNFTGAFAGTTIQYLFPALFVYRARRLLTQADLPHNNPLASPFAHTAWIIAVLAFMTLAVSLVLTHILFQ